MSVTLFRALYVLTITLICFAIAEIGNLDFFKVTAAVSFVMVADMASREAFIKLLILQMKGNDDGNSSESE